ncbi:hypothetical protein BGZ73_008402 [Actinomortierella ambigua]|nr:hypothetical protein BGZ73_008402 [Actinomortierella ambigua]
MGLRHQRHHPHAHNPRELKQYWPSSRHIATTPNRHPHQYLKPHEVLARKMSRTLRFSNDKKKKPRYSYVKASEVRLHQQQQQQQQQQQTLQIPRQSLVEADGSVAGSKSCKDHTGRKRFRAATPTTTTGSSRVFTNQSGTTGKSSLMQGLVGWINTRMRTRQAKKQKRPLQSVCDDDEDAFADRIDLVQQQQHHHHHQQHEQEQPHMPISIATMMPRPVQTETDLGPSTMRHHSPLRQSPLCQPSVETLRARETQAQEYARTIKALWQMAEEEEQAYQLAVEQHEWTDEGATTATASEVGGDDLQSQHQASTEAAAITPSATSVVHTGRDDFWQWHSGARTSIQHQTRFGAGHLYYQERQAQRRKEAEGKQEQAEESEMMDVEGGESKAATKERNGALLFEQPQRSKASTPDREPRDNDDDMEEEEEQEEAQVLYRLQMQYGKWQGGLCLDVPGLTRARTHTASTTDGYQYDKSFESQSLGQTNVGGIDGHGYYDIDVDDAEEIEGHLAMERALQSRVQLESVEESEKKGVQPQQPQQANAMHSGSLTRATRASVVRPRVVVLESEGELDLASTKRRIQAQREQQRRWNGW